MDTKPITIAGLLYDGWETDDLLGPMAVFHHASTVAEELGKFPKANVLLIGEESRAYKSPQGPICVADKSFKDIGQVDVLVVPGGFTTVVETNRPKVLDFIKAQSRDAKLVTSVCTGSVLLASAGLLDGRSATTNKMYYDLMITYGPKAKWIRKARYVQDGKFITSSGVSAGIDMAFAAVEILWGAEVKDTTARKVGYVPVAADDDPFAAVHKPLNAYIGYVAATIFHYSAPFLGPRVTEQIRRKTPKKRTVWVLLVDGATESLSLAHSVECFGAPDNTGDIAVSFVQVVLANKSASNRARTSTNVVFECDFSIPAGQAATTATIPLAQRDILLIPDISDQSMLHMSVATTVSSLSRAVGFTVAAGPVAAELCGCAASVRQAAASSPVGWARDGKMLVARDSMSIIGPTLEVIRELFGEKRCRNVVNGVEAFVPKM